MLPRPHSGSPLPMLCITSSYYYYLIFSLSPDTRGYDIPQVVTGEEDEGFQDDWLSNLYGRGHRASTGSTMSSHSTGKRRKGGEGGKGGRLERGTTA